MDLHDLKTLTDKAYNNSQVTRRRAADDIVFARVTQWDDNLLRTSDLAYRGQFDILRKAIRSVQADMRANPVQVDFEPINETREDSADIIDGLYRADDRRNSSQEAYEVAGEESVICGVGAWELYTEYESMRGQDNKQVIKRMPIHEANNVVFWDPNSKLMDKSDADYVCILTQYSPDAYQEMAREVTGDPEFTFSEQNFKYPQYSYTFPWTAGNFEWVYVGTFYKREQIKDQVYTVMDPFGDTAQYYKKDFEEKMEDLLDGAYTITSKKDVERWIVTKYIASGEDILAEYRIAGEHIPIVPCYGERGFVEGQEHWEGIVRLAKDPQRLHNFMMSYVGDIASRSPRQKNIFYPEQVQGFEDMFDEAGADNNLSYYLINRFDAAGTELPPGPVGQLAEQPIPSSVQSLIALTKDSVADVAGAGMPKELADIDLSGEAIAQLNARFDQQSLVYQDHMKHAKRRDAEIYASMAAEIYDVPREVTLTLPDGTQKTEMVMQQIYDGEEGETVIINDLRNAQFDVYSEIGPSYQSQKDKLRSEITNQMQTMAPDDPMRMLYMLKHAELMDGVDTKDIREYARKQMILNGFKEPETDEEMMMVAQQAEAANQPDPAMLMGQAEMTSAQAELMREQREAIKDAADIEKDKADTSVDIFRAQTERGEAIAEAEQNGQKLEIEKAKAIGESYEKMANQLVNPLRGAIR